jgi:hypothetical protein
MHVMLPEPRTFSISLGWDVSWCPSGHWHSGSIISHSIADHGVTTGSARVEVLGRFAVLRFSGQAQPETGAGGTRPAVNMDGGRRIERVFTGGLWAFRPSADAGAFAAERSDATNRGGTRMGRLNWHFGCGAASGASLDRGSPLNAPEARAGRPRGILPKYSRVHFNRVHFAAFGQIRSFRQESRKSSATRDYRCLLIGLPKMHSGFEYRWILKLPRFFK